MWRWQLRLTLRLLTFAQPYTKKGKLLTTPVATSTQVGTLYKVLGVLALVGLLILDIVAVFKGQLGMVTLGINAILLLTILALIRPQFFNDAMKTVAAKLPI